MLIRLLSVVNGTIIPMLWVQVPQQRVCVLLLCSALSEAPQPCKQPRFVPHSQCSLHVRPVLDQQSSNCFVIPLDCDRKRRQSSMIGSLRQREIVW